MLFFSFFECFEMEITILYTYFVRSASLLKLYYFNFMFIGVLPEYMSVNVRSPGLELQTCLSYHVPAGS